MNKNFLISLIIVILVIIAIIIFIHYSPVWVSITSVIYFLIGGVVGWILHVFYKRNFNKEIKK